ncbi:MAG: alpha/beta fold hydrolase [Phycisphaerales bacterium]|nr:MAG: alpha/beta fold hydrolase [Phycisphaerales bacterium]
MRMSKAIAVRALTVGLVLVLADVAGAQALGRRGLMGVQLAPLDAATAASLKLASAEGVLIGGVVPGTPAEAAGLKAGDVIVAIGDAKAADIPSLTTVLRKYYAGDVLPLKVVREGEPIELKLTLAERPKETSDEFDVLYEAAYVGDKRVRTIITRPKGEGARPAVLFIQPMSQMSMDFGPRPHPFKRLVGELTKAGYVVVRVERVGVGDSEGEDPRQTDVKTDVATFRGALEKLATYDYVDKDNVFVLTHSLGAAIAPMVARGAPVRGVITYGAVGESWIDATVEASARSWKLEMLDDGEIAERTRKLAAFLNGVVAEGKTPRQVLESDAGLKQTFDSFVQSDEYIGGQHYTYVQAMEKLDVADAWKACDSPVLAIWGEADFVATRADSAMIASAAKNGTLLALPGIDHNFEPAQDQEESYLAGFTNRFNEVLVEKVTAWMKEKMKKP